MTAAVVCASHSPMLLEEEFSSKAVCDGVRASFDRLTQFVREFSPDCVVQFSSDHFHGFHYDNMPSFCVGAAARSCGDWKTHEGALNVDEGFALDVLSAVRDTDIDAAVSFDMIVDHGFVQMWEAMFGRFDQYPTVPVFINALAYPIPKYRRARLLGEAVGRFAKASGKKILFAASGGLSHDPVVPDIRGASPAVKQRLLGKTPLGPEQQKQREHQVREAATQLMNGKGPSRPLNPDWDRTFLRALREGNWALTASLAPDQVTEEAGSAANETLCWVAAAAALPPAATIRWSRKTTWTSRAGLLAWRTLPHSGAERKTRTHSDRKSSAGAKMP